MVRGCEKKLIRLGSPESRYFEEVLFILRDNSETGRAATRDIVAEANRILAENTLQKKRREKKGSPLLPFLLGALASAAALLPFAFL
ncbi:MAG: hypothetical protein J6V07_06570 [Clostridia bacterium]|nr:hypothetical protein [Clostridia bacterium]